MTASARNPQKAGPDFALHRSLDSVGSNPAQGKIQSLTILQDNDREEGLFLIAKGQYHHLPPATRTCRLWVIEGTLLLNGARYSPALPTSDEGSAYLKAGEERLVRAPTNVFVFVRYFSEAELATETAHA